MTASNGGYGRGRPPLHRRRTPHPVQALADDYGVTKAAIYYHLKTTMRHLVDPRVEVKAGDHAPIGPQLPRSPFEFDPQPWMVDSLCAQTDPEAFYPEKGGSTREAKAVCLRCEVREPCLEYALEREERFGIWGGLSERERRRINKQRRAQA